MASIRENRKNGKIVSYRFTVCLERNAEGKQIRRYLTWTPPSFLPLVKARKAAEKEADKWETKIREEYKKPLKVVIFRLLLFEVIRQK